VWKCKTLYFVLPEQSYCGRVVFNMLLELVDGNSFSFFFFFLFVAWEKKIDSLRKCGKTELPARL